MFCVQTLLRFDVVLGARFSLVVEFMLIVAQAKYSFVVSLYMNICRLLIVFWG